MESAKAATGVADCHCQFSLEKIFLCFTFTAKENGNCYSYHQLSRGQSKYTRAPGNQDCVTMCAEAQPPCNRSLQSFMLPVKFTCFYPYSNTFVGVRDKNSSASGWAAHTSKGFANVANVVHVANIYIVANISNQSKCGHAAPSPLECANEPARYCLNFSGRPALRYMAPRRQVNFRVFKQLQSDPWRAGVIYGRSILYLLTLLSTHRG